MKNSASNQCQIQALQRQAQHLLPPIAHVLAKLGYQKITPQRISQHNDDNEVNYQGLTHARCKSFGQVMIKWQLSLNPQNSAPLNHEIRVLKALNEWQNNQNNTIAPSLLAYNSITITALDQPQELILLVMPYYQTGSLAQVLKQTLNEQQKHTLIMQAAQMIDNLHQSGWIHGDIKLSNFLIEDNLSPLLTDFALARRIDNGFDNNFNEGRENSAGTPAYLAPECWQGQGATVQSDIYAFGIMMYEILMGKRPFAINLQSDDPLQDWALQHYQQPVPALSKQYAHYQMIIDKALAKRVEQRYGSMEEVLRDFKRI